MKAIRQFMFSLCCLLPLALTAAAQSEAQVRDMQKVYKTGQIPGLEVIVYLQEENGSLTPVAPQRKFHQGEKVKVRIESNFRGYLYIVNHGTSGTKRLIFPDHQESNRIQPGTAYLLPSTYEIAFDENAGFETLQVIVSPQRLPVLDAALKQEEGKLTSNQIVAIEGYWKSTAPNQAGIFTVPKEEQRPQSAFDKDKGTTTVLSDGSRDPAFKRRPPAPSKPKRKVSEAPLSVGIQLQNVG
ncbi:MAG TPA: DUF4384 domain-containing protein, partial [Blastocatellia bacterium]|nr:DUF4384 domain-containing protein [Blastocatellia bacterium]